MIDHEAISTTVGDFLRAQVRGDAAGLARVTLPHPDLAMLVAQRPVTVNKAVLDSIDQMQLASDEAGAGRHFVRAFVNGSVQMLIVVETPEGPRVDARYVIESLRADDECRAVARRFYLAMLTGDLEALTDLAFDPRGIELIANDGVPSGEHGQLEHVAQIVSFAQLQQGEPFSVPSGVEFVGARHAEMGITVFNALTPDGEIPFLLRKRDGKWKVIAYHFIQGAVLARGGTIG